jgi:hypothetical protein
MERGARFLPAAAALAAGLVYLSLPTRNYYWDGIAFAIDIERSPGVAPWLIHPNHLVYKLFGYFVYHGLNAVAPGIRAVAALQIANSLAGAAAVYLVCRILLEASGSAYISGCLGLLFAFSATWWKFATDADSYILSVAFLLWCFFLLLPERSPRPLLMGMAHAGAMVFHQLAVFFYPAGLLGLFYQTSGRHHRNRAWSLISYSAVAALATGAAYYCGFRLAGPEHTAQGLWQWVTARAPGAAFSFRFIRNLSETIAGHVRLLLGGKPFRVLASRDAAGLCCGVVLLAIASALGYWAGLHRQERNRFFWREGMRRLWIEPLVRLSVLWAAVYVVFLFFWLPQNTFYRLFYLPALILPGGLLAKVCTGKERRAGRYRLALLTAAAGVWNFGFFIRPNSKIVSNPPLAFALEMRARWPAGTVIYHSRFHSDNWTIRYFTAGTIWKELKLEDLPALDGEIANIYQSGHTAWIETSAAELLSSTRNGSEWLRVHSGRSYGIVNRKHRILVTQVYPAGG